MVEFDESELSPGKSSIKTTTVRDVAHLKERYGYFPHMSIRLD